MATPVTDSIGATGRTHSTLQQWIDAMPSSLVSADQYWTGVCYNDATFTAGLTATGITTDATRYAELTVADGHSFCDHADRRTNALKPNQANGVLVSLTAVYGSAINEGIDLRISRMQFLCSCASVVRGSGPRRDMLVQNNIAGPCYRQPKSCFNCIAIQNGSTQSAGAFNELVNSGLIVNCLAIRPTNQTPTSFAFNIASGTPTMVNTAVFGFSAVTGGTDSWSGSSHHNATDLASGLPGSSNQHSVSYSGTTPFTQANATTGLDLRPVASTALDGNGQTDATNAPKDITGLTRPTDTTIGPWEITGDTTPATGYTFTGPTAGAVDTPSTAFTVEPNGNADGVTVTPQTSGEGHFEPSSITFNGGNSATFVYVPESTDDSPHILSVTNDGDLDDPEDIEFAVLEGLITLTSPIAKQLFQRTGIGAGSGYADITIAGTYVGSPTSLEARWGTGPWVEVVPDPAGGEFSTKLPFQPVGVGDLQVRFSDNHDILTTISDVKVGDFVLVMGQSNADGRLQNTKTFAGPAGYAALFDGDTYGAFSEKSVWPLLATLITANSGIPVVFVKCAVGGTAITYWNNPSNAGYQLVRTKLADVTPPLAYMLWWQGETESDMDITAEYYAGHLATLAEGIRADYGIKTMPMKLQTMSGSDEETVNEGIGLAWANDPNIHEGADFHPIASGLHPETDQEADDIAAAIWAKLQPLYYAAAPEGVAASASLRGGFQN